MDDPSEEAVRGQSPLSTSDPTYMDQTQLSRLLRKGSRASTKAAWHLIGSLSEDEVKRRSEIDNSTYLHQVVIQATDAHKRYGDVNHLVPLIYRLALKGVLVNAQNAHGNTCLHLACLRPNAERLCPHLIRIGADPVIQNQKGCRIIHTYKNHSCQLVKGQTSARSGLWNAVEKEDLGMVEKLMKTWCRVKIRKNKTLRQLAEETSNQKLIRLLDSYEAVNEAVCVAFSCDCEKLKTILKLSRLDLSQKDESCDVPKPLVVSLQDLGPWTWPVIRALRDLEAVGPSTYEEEFKEKETAFENSEFFQLTEECTDDSLLRALDLILTGEVDIGLVSSVEATRGWTYFHFVVDCYIQMKPVNEERARLFIRAMYRLTLAGIDVNARDALSETALVKAAATADQTLMNHLIRLGCDASISDAKGRCVSEEVYEGRGKLVFGNRYRVTDLPGLWAAVQSNDVGKAERWLKSWARVNNIRGDRKLIDIGRSLGQKDIVRLLESHEQINEFVCATFASDLPKMMNILALGSGKRKVNTIDDFFHVGYTWNLYAEFIARPIIINTFELCTPSVVDFLLNFGADLSKQYEESAPCGPTAFWAFRDHVSNDIAAVVAKYADVKVKDELGCTLLHRIVQKNRVAGKMDVISALLDRGVDVASRDYEGCTARDYASIYRVENGVEIRQMIDSFVLELVNSDQSYKLETLLLDAYDHLVDIRGTKRNKTAQEIAELKQYDQVLRFLREFDKYTNDIDKLQVASKEGDLVSVSKLSGEKRCAWARDKGGRTLLHIAVLYGHPPVVKFLIEQHHLLVNSRDNMNRTPLHLCVCLKERHLIWPLLQDGGADPNLVDVNNMSVYDYVRQLETPTPTRNKPRGRRWRDYRPNDLVEFEQNMTYGVKAEVYEFYGKLLSAIETNSPTEEIKRIFDSCTFDVDLLTKFNLQESLLRASIRLKRDELVIYLISEKSCPHDITIPVYRRMSQLQQQQQQQQVNAMTPAQEGGQVNLSLLEYSEQQEMTDLANFLRNLS